MKLIFPLFICITFLTGCPTMDPATGTIDIFNYSDSAIYVYQSCSDSLSCEPALDLFLVERVPRTDAEGNRMKDTIAPDYRINAYSYGIIYAFGSSEKPTIPCDGEYLTLFYIKETTMRTNSWDEICKNQLYERKVKFTNQELDASSWKITYEPKDK